MNLKPVCVKCRRFYRCEKNGYMFVEGMPKGTADWQDPDYHSDEHWQDYKMWRGDLWKCQVCGHEIIVGVAAEPIRIQHEPDFQEVKERLGITLRINDC